MEFWRRNLFNFTFFYIEVYNADPRKLTLNLFFRVWKEPYSRNRILLEKPQVSHNEISSFLFIPLLMQGSKTKPKWVGIPALPVGAVRVPAPHTQTQHHGGRQAELKNRYDIKKINCKAKYGMHTQSQRLGNNSFKQKRLCAMYFWCTDRTIWGGGDRSISRIGKQMYKKFIYIQLDEQTEVLNR